jgi:methylmalonyl-CoA mutase
MKEQIEFSEFSAISKKDWLERIAKDLRGKPIQDLYFKNESGMAISPFWAKEDVDIPNLNDGRRGSLGTSNNWFVNAIINHHGHSFAEQNKRILNLLSRDVNSITITEGHLSNQDLAQLFSEVKLPYILTAFDNPESPSSILAWLENTIDTDQKSTTRLHFNIDPFGQALISGRWKGLNQTNFHKLPAFSKEVSSQFPLGRTAFVNGVLFHNSGANAVQELAYSLAAAHEHVVSHLEAGMSIDDTSARLKFELACHPDYFLTIAKIRAMRVLYSTLISEYGPEHNCSRSAYISATTSGFYSTLYDPYNNMLRNTTQAMSAVIGGVEQLTVQSHSRVWKDEDDFGDRIAANISHTLKEECHLDKVKDIGGGAYYIEHLTTQLTDAAWEIFKSVESEGGFIAAMNSGRIQKDIQSSAEAKVKSFEKDNIKILGVNLYPVKDESHLDDLPELPSEEENVPGDIMPISAIRLVGEFEQKRLEEELQS